METRHDPRFATQPSSQRVGSEGWAGADFILANFSGTDSFVQKHSVFILSEFLFATVLFVSFPPHQSAHYFLRLPSAETKKPVQIEKFLQVTSKRRERERMIIFF
jgi:hypothetical protein